DRNRLGVAILYGDTIALRTDLESSVPYCSILQYAQKLPGLGFKLLLFLGNKWNYVAKNIERGDAWISGATYCLHGCDEDRFHTEDTVERSQRHDQSDRRAVGVRRDES